MRVQAVSDTAETVPVEEWLREDDAAEKVILSVSFPPLDSAKHVFR